MGCTASYAGGGTAIFTAYAGGDQGDNGASLIQLKARAGLRGLNITQANLTSVNLDHPEQTLKTPFWCRDRRRRICHQPNDSDRG